MEQPSSRSPADELAALRAEARACRRCLEAGYPITPGAVLSGPHTARIMIVGQAPGVSEAQVGRPFNGMSGRRLFQWLCQVGWTEDSFRVTQYLTALTKCYPGKGRGGKGDRVPTRAEQTYCASFLERELALVCPEIIVPVGGLAVRRFLGQVKLTEVVGSAFRDAEVWIVPLPHPSGASLWLNRAKNRQQVSRALSQLRRLSHELGLLQ